MNLTEGFYLITPLATMIGVFGAGVYILGYFLLQLGFIRGTGVLYPLLVILAASSVLFSMTQDFNLAGSIIQLAYISISILGLLRGYLSRHLVRLSGPEKQFIQNYLGVLKPHYARKLLDTARVKVFGPGETLIAEGKTSDFLAYVLDGQTTVLKNGQVINRCGADQILGELTFGRGLPATASVKAAETTTCLVFDSDRLGRLLRRNRQIDDALKAAHFDNMRQKLLSSNSHTVDAKMNSAVA
ncbi:cyclic nucleotide-binding domain-containing protein [Ruegeria sp.]|uniref:cyclic nucleotide-binding domain-containing protein n=1 Tax=Ruegeria sp. TaxID=1879320 RepID=UPI0023240221|nr:cyclic nucleotide-binding domain-containing protein [Ruegeria sp.]MDA7964163.1 cyclic nucleotide-binding domain-containing protein [Ruegeria sp.]